MRPNLLKAAALALLLPAAAPLRAQSEPVEATITVVDAASGAPVANARVQVGGVPEGVMTSGSGVARLRVPAGNRILTVSRLGYEPRRVAVNFAPGGAVTRTVELSPDAVQVQGVSVRAERRDAGLDNRGFYDRQSRGLGVFMTGEEIDQLRPQRTLDLFRRIRGFTVAYTPRGDPYVTITRGTSGLGQCGAVLVYVDGAPFRSLTKPSEALDMVPPENIAGIEAYAGAASIPAEYNVSGAACGVVLIWTRTG